MCVEGDDNIVSCAFYEGFGSEYLERDLIFTGHKKGVVNVILASNPKMKLEGTNPDVDMEPNDFGRRFRPRACETDAPSRPGGIQCECSDDLYFTNGTDGVYWRPGRASCKYFWGSYLPLL